MILDAARAAFSELGLDGATCGRSRIEPAIRQAPSTAIPQTSKKSMAPCSESLQRLKRRRNRHWAGLSASAGDLLRAKAGAFYAFCRDNRRNSIWASTFFDGMKPRGLTAALNTN